MVPIYALISCASFLFWVRNETRRLSFGLTKSRLGQNHSTPLILIRDCYEGVVLTSFFYLLLTYLSPNPEEQKEVFRLYGLSRENDRQRRRRGQKPQRWVFPLGFVKSRPAVSSPNLVSRALLRKVPSGRVVFSPNHEMGRAAILCDQTNVCVTRGALVAVHSAQLRTTLAAVILEYMGLYCEASWSPGWGHLYVSRFT